MAAGRHEPGAAGEEVPLLGGSMTAGVVRVGDTVRRPVGPWTRAVHSLLRYLEDVGFEGAPRVLGIDQRGREVLTFLPGDPTPNWSDEALVVTARLVRRLHEALAGFVPPSDAIWHFPSIGRRASAACIGHNDLCPVNTVYADGVPYGFIDWDLAGPDRPLYDLAFAAFSYTSLRPDGFWPRPGCPRPPDRIRRLRVFCDAYGVEDRSALLAAVEASLQEELAETVESGGRGILPYATFFERGEARLRRLELAWLAENREALELALQ
jgi:Phosphotransferase enzyme family